MLLLVRDVRWFSPAWLSLGIAVAAAVAYIARTQPPNEYAPSEYLLVLLALLGLVCAGQRSRVIVSQPSVVRVIRFMAGYSFTLYLIHHTLMYPIYLVWPNAGWRVFLPLVIASNLRAAALAVVTEMRHRDVSRFLLLIPGGMRSLWSSEMSAGAARLCARQGNAR